MLRSAVLTTAGALVALSSAPAFAAGPQRLLLDAQATAGRPFPATPRTGDVQTGRGPLRDAAGRRLGRFSFVCRIVRTTASGDAAERCRGRASFAGGTLRVAGPARLSSDEQRWRIVGGAGRLADARGGVTVDDLGPAESAVLLRLVAPTRVRAGAVPVPAANHAFLARADAACAAAAARLAALPPFPLRDFDPLHPDPAQLRQVGEFFTGAGDPRPALTQLLARLTALGSPPAARSRWTAVLAARRADLAARDAQDTAALAGDVAGFIGSLPEIAASARRMTLSALAAGAPACRR